MSAPPWLKQGGAGKQTASNASSSDSPSGLKVRSDPAGGPGVFSVVNSMNKRVGTIKKIGGQFACSADGYKAKAASASALLSKFGK
jgi:hypothetical protein